MIEFRLAKKGEIGRLKEIWKLCFRDSDNFIDFYYANRFKEDETLLLLQGGSIIAMLTILPVKLVTPDYVSINSTMLYAIATHPNSQGRGYATKLIEYSNKHLSENKKQITLLVPANKDLFEFYLKQGYEEGFYIRESLINSKKMAFLEEQDFNKCSIFPISPEEYNQRRTDLLRGWRRFHIEYSNSDIIYQKKLSQLAGADIYGIDIGEVQGCLAIERITSKKLIVKEILLPEEFLKTCLKQLFLLLPADQYILRTPPFLGQELGGDIRPFGMLRVNSKLDNTIKPGELGYLGFAFD